MEQPQSQPPPAEKTSSQTGCWVIVCSICAAPVLFCLYIYLACSLGYRTLDADEFKKVQLESLQPILYDIVPWGGDYVYGRLFVDGHELLVRVGMGDYRQVQASLTKEEQERLKIIREAWGEGWNAGKGSLKEAMKVRPTIPPELKEVWEHCWRRGASQAEREGPRR